MDALGRPRGSVLELARTAREALGPRISRITRMHFIRAIREIRG